jgi:hypothetical protein
MADEHEQDYSLEDDQLETFADEDETKTNVSDVVEDPVRHTTN